MQKSESSIYFSLCFHRCLADLREMLSFNMSGPVSFFWYAALMLLGLN